MLVDYIINENRSLYVISLFLFFGKLFVIIYYLDLMRSKYPYYFFLYGVRKFPFTFECEYVDKSN